MLSPDDECTCLRKPNILPSTFPAPPTLLYQPSTSPLSLLPSRLHVLPACGKTPITSSAGRHGISSVCGRMRKSGPRTKGTFVAVGSGWLPTHNGHILRVLKQTAVCGLTCSTEQKLGLSETSVWKFFSFFHLENQAMAVLRERI